MRNTLIAIVISLVAVLGVICCLVFVGTSDGPPYVFDSPPYDPPAVTSDAREEQEEQREDTLAERNRARKEPPRTGLSLSGTVVNADRRSVAGAEVELRHADTSTSTAVALATARTDATGHFTLTFEGSSAGIYQVAVRHADYLPEIKRWSGASQGAVDIQLSFRPAKGAGPERRVRVYVPPPKRDPEPTELVRRAGRDRSDRRGDKSDRRGDKSDRRGEMMERFDQDGDGELSDEERQAARESRGGGRRGGDREGGARAGRGRGGGSRGGGGGGGRRGGGRGRR